MFNFFRFRKLNGFLADAGITGKPAEPVRLHKLEACEDSLFNLIFDDGKQNFARLLEMLYDRQSAAVRIKLLILLHHLIMQDRSYAELFLEHPKSEFRGLLITKKQHLQTQHAHKYTQPTGDLTLRGPETSVSVSRNATRRHIDDDVDFSDVNVYLHMYLVLPYLSHLLKICANYDLFEDAKHPPENLRKADFNLIWRLINTIKAVIPMKSVLTHVGRYYMSEHGYIVSFVEQLTNCLSTYYDLLEHHVSTAMDSYKTLEQGEMENLLGIVDEIVELNEQLSDIYYNRYFSKLTKHIAVPKWISLQNDEADTIHRHFQQQYGIRHRGLGKMAERGWEVMDKSTRREKEKDYEEI